MNPPRGQGRKPCQLAADAAPAWPPARYYFPPNHKTAAERAVAVVTNQITVPGFAIGDPFVAPFPREDWDYLGKPACDRLRLVCGPWGTVDSRCRCTYPPGGATVPFLEQLITPTGDTQDISVCRKVGHKVVQVQVEAPWPLQTCLGEEPCASGTHAYGTTWSREEVHYGNETTGYDYISGTAVFQASANCPPEGTLTDTSVGGDLTNAFGGSYTPCDGGTWTSTSLLVGGTVPKSSAYQQMLDGTFWQFWGPVTITPLGDGCYRVTDDAGLYQLEYCEPDEYEPGKFHVEFTLEELTGSLGRVAWTFDVQPFTITNGASNAQFQALVTAGALKFQSWHLDSPYLLAHRQTAHDDAIYPWRTDGRRTVAPLLFDLYACDGSKWPRTIGPPLLDAQAHALRPQYAYAFAHGSLYSDGLLPDEESAITVGSMVYVLKATVTGDGQVAIGADANACLTNLYHALNNSGGVPGTDYQVTAANPIATAYDLDLTNHILRIVSRFAVSPSQYWLDSTDPSLGWDGGAMTGSFQLGTPLFDWTHTVYKWENRTVCGTPQDIWVNYQYGRFVDGTLDATGIPLGAESFTDRVAGTILYPGSVVMFGPTAVRASATLSGGTRGPVTAYAAGGILLQKAIETKVAVASHNFFRPCGLDRYLMDEAHVFAINADGAAVGGGELVATFTAAPDFVVGETVVVFGVPGADGLWTVKTVFGPTITLDTFLTGSGAYAPAAALLRGPATEFANPDFGNGIVGRQRFPKAWPLNGRAAVSNVTPTDTPGEITLIVDDPGTLCPGDFVSFATTPDQAHEVLSVLGAQLTLEASPGDASPYLLNAPYTVGATVVRPPHWTWHDTRPKGTWWLVSMAGVGDGSTPGDWWGPDCWDQPAGLDPAQTITEHCTPAAGCGPVILDIPLPGDAGTPAAVPWTCGSVAVNYAVQCVLDPIYQTPAVFSIEHDGITYTPTWPTPPYCEPVLQVAGLFNPSAPSEAASLPAGCAFTAPPPPRAQPSGGDVGEAPLWLTPWKLFEGGRQLL